MQTLELTRIAEFVAGLVVLALVAFDLFQTILLPRPSVYNRRLLSTILLRLLWRAWRAVASIGDAQSRRENVLGAFAPVALILQLLFWSAELMLGFAFLFAALSSQLRPPAESFWDALYFSATTLLPLSYGDVVPVALGARLATIAESGAGVALVALVISLLFSLYGSFQEREKLVVKLDALAGAPPAGLHILEQVAKHKTPERLERTFDEWSEWTADVLESHLAYPILLYFRSSHDNEAWLNSFGSVMDAALLVVSTIEDHSEAAARQMLTIGLHLVEDFGWYFRLQNTGVVGIEREEFDTAHRKLEELGYRCRSTQEAWERFAALRQRYASPLNALARRLSIIPAQWIGDRSYVPHRR